MVSNGVKVIEDDLIGKVENGFEKEKYRRYTLLSVANGGGTSTFLFLKRGVI